MSCLYSWCERRFFDQTAAEPVWRGLGGQLLHYCWMLVRRSRQRWLLLATPHVHSLFLTHTFFFFFFFKGKTGNATGSNVEQIWLVCSQPLLSANHSGRETRRPGYLFTKRERGGCGGGVGGWGGPAGRWYSQKLCRSFTAEMLLHSEMEKGGEKTQENTGKSANCYYCDC